VRRRRETLPLQPASAGRGRPPDSPSWDGVPPEDHDTPAEVDATFRTQRRIAVGYFLVFLVVTLTVPLLTLVLDWWSEGQLLGTLSPNFLTVAAGLYVFFFFLGLAAAMKLVPALLLLAVPLAKLPKLLLPFSIVLLCAYLPYAAVGKKVLGFLPNYFSDPYEIFNPGLLQLALFDAAEALSLPFLWVRYVLLFAFGAVLFLSLRRFAEGRPEALIERACVILGAHLLFIYPAFHPWYLLALVPFLALSPSPAWIYLSLAIPLSYLKYLAPNGLMPEWVTWAQFAPLYVLLGLQYARIKALDEWRYRWQPGSQRASSTTS
jgi:hypothetical protein